MATVIMAQHVNPIIPGFAPDPSIVRIGDTFFVVTSSFHLFPGLPIFASKDLASWEHIGNAINRTTQIELSGSSTALNPADDGSNDKVPATGGLWAPTIRHHNGITYIACTNTIYGPYVKGACQPSSLTFQNFIISAKDIRSDEWSDPVFFDYNGIDPDLFFDDDGRAYVSGSSWRGKPSNNVSCFEIDVRTGKRLSEERVIWDGFSKHIPEGPHIYKRGGYYYLMDAEGGTHEGHKIAIARSREVWGPYESCERNPIVRPSAGLGHYEYVQYNGHGDLFQDRKGQWWMLCLAVRKDRDGRVVMGRETFLTRVDWPVDQAWPLVQQPLRAVQPPTSYEKVPALRHPTIDLVWLRTRDARQCSVSTDGRTITLVPSETDISGRFDKSVGFVGRRQRRLEGAAYASLAVPITRGAAAAGGLVYYRDEHRFARILYDSVTSSVVLELMNRTRVPPFTTRKVVARLPDGETTLEFRIAYTERVLEFLYRTGGGSVGDYNDDRVGASPAGWTSAGLIDTLALAAADFTGPIVGVFATVLAGATGAAVVLPKQADDAQPNRWTFEQVQL